ncbi:MAG: hypothetical protein V3R95_06170 [Dehalococcoidia bacterium]
MRDDAFASLTLAEVEEVSGELHRRIGVALRTIGERRADERGEHDASPRQLVASLAASLELAAGTLGAIAAAVTPADGRSDRHPTAVAAVMYAAPSVGALLSRLEQDRRLLASVARTLESRLDELHATAWGKIAMRELVSEVAVAAAAACAQDLEQRAAVATA